LSVTRVAVAAIALAGCTRVPHRPDSALALCEQLSKKYFAAEKLECSTVSDAAGLTLLQALEGAKLAPAGSRSPEESVMFVSYRAKVEQPSLGGLLQAAARELTFALPMVEASNDGARVSVWVTRGKLSAADFERLQKEIAAFASLEPKSS
jgi:hypothetical protein